MAIYFGKGRIRDRNSIPSTNPVILKLWHASKALEGLVKLQIANPHSQNF